MKSSNKICEVYANWDEEAQVWYVDKSDIPGLHAEAESLDDLRDEILALAPELMLANGLVPLHGGQAQKDRVPFELFSRKREYVVLAC